MAPTELQGIFKWNIQKAIRVGSTASATCPQSQTGRLLHSYAQHKIILGSLLTWTLCKAVYFLLNNLFNTRTLIYPVLRSIMEDWDVHCCEENTLEFYLLYRLDELETNRATQNLCHNGRQFLVELTSL
jgi:hypothetical protein